MQEILRADWMDNPAVIKILVVAVGILAILFISRLLQRALSNKALDSASKYRLRKSVAFAGYVLVITFLLAQFGSGLKSLAVALGVVGAGIAFALQEVIVSIAGWFAISLGSFYRIGDRVQLGGIKGDVIDISVLRTTLMEVGQWVNADLYNGRIVRVANSFVFKEPVFNYSGDFPFLWDDLVLPVKYGSDIRLARAMLNEVAQELLGEYASGAELTWSKMVEKYMIEDASVAPLVSLMPRENWLEFTLRYVVDYKKRRVTKDILYTRIMEEIEKTGGKIAITSATLEIVKTPVIDLNYRGITGRLDK